MKKQIDSKKTVNVSAESSERKRYDLEIILRAKEAKRAALELKKVEARAKAVEEAWSLRLLEARKNAKAEQERLRIQVMKQIKEGNMAALIKAEAMHQVTLFRQQSYEMALKKSLKLKLSYELQQKSFAAAIAQSEIKDQ